MICILTFLSSTVPTSTPHVYKSQGMCYNTCLHQMAVYDFFTLVVLRKIFRDLTVLVLMLLEIRAGEGTKFGNIESLGFKFQLFKLIGKLSLQM